MICHWCTKEMPDSAKVCPNCGKLREDIRKDKINAYVCLISMIAFFFGFLEALRDGEWNEVSVRPGFSSHFSMGIFLSSGSGWLVIIVFLVILAMTRYYVSRVKKKLGTKDFF